MAHLRCFCSQLLSTTFFVELYPDGDWWRRSSSSCCGGLRCWTRHELLGATRKSVVPHAKPLHMKEWKHMPLMCWSDWCSFQGLECMRSIAGGASAGGSLALVHRLLTLFDSPSPDLLPSCNWQLEWSLDYKSFLSGLLVGCFLVLAIQFLTALRWAFLAVVQAWLSGSPGVSGPTARGGGLYKLL